MAPKMTNTALSKEQSKILATMLDRKYASYLAARYFDIESRTDNQVVTIKVTLRDAKGKFVYPVEARIALDDQDLSVSEARDLLLDYVDAYFDEFLSNGEETLLTLDWSSYECDGYDIQLRGHIINSHLETMADELIAGKELDLGRLTGKVVH